MNTQIHANLGPEDETAHKFLTMSHVSSGWRGEMCASAGNEAAGYHWLICVLLKLNQTDPGDVLQVHVAVGALRGVSVQVRRGGWRRYPQRLVAVNLVGHHVVGLQQGLQNREQE